jgi:hypothetical protein
VIFGEAPPVYPEAEPERKKPSPVNDTSETNLSLVMVKGYNDNLSFSLDTEQNFDILKHRIGLKGRFIAAKAKDRDTSEIYYAHLKYDRMMGLDPEQ